MILVLGRHLLDPERQSTWEKVEDIEFYWTYT